MPNETPRGREEEQTAQRTESRKQAAESSRGEHMVYRIFVEKKPGQDSEAKALAREIREFLGITALQNLRLLNRYDAEGLDKAHFDYAVRTVFSEPQVDNASEEVSFPGAAVFAVEYLPGQFDQRADSAAQCIQLIFQGWHHRRP